MAFAMVVAGGPTEPASVRAARAGITLPAAFDAWFARMTSVEPSRRPPKATLAVQDLAAAFDVVLPAGLSSSKLSMPDDALPGSQPGTTSRHATAMSATLANTRGHAASGGSRLWAVALASLVALVAAGWWLASRRAPASSRAAAPLATLDPPVSAAGTVPVPPPAASSASATPATTLSAPPESSDAAPPRTPPVAIQHPTQTAPGPSAQAPVPPAGSHNPPYTRE